jgi:hypothetical protein
LFIVEQKSSVPLFLRRKTILAFSPPIQIFPLTTSPLSVNENNPFGD